MIGKILRQLRESENMTQADMAEALEIERSTYTKYESGKSKPDSIMLEKLADFFHVSVDYLLGRTNNRSLHETKAAYKIDVSDLPDEAVKQVEEYIELIKLKFNQDKKLKNK